MAKMKQKLKEALTGGLGDTTRATGRRQVGKSVGKVVAKHVSKTAGKALARTAASPWLLAADGAEFVTERGARALGYNDKTARKTSKCVGFATSVGIGAGVAGPVGAAAGAALWGLGEVISWVW